MELPASNEYFTPNKLGKQGLRSQCKKCSGIYHAEKRKIKNSLRPIVYKECNTCNEKFPKNYEFFTKVKGGISFGKQRYRCSASCTECENKRKSEKKCNCCNKVLPKNEDNFYYKKVTCKVKGGEREYNVARSICKNCDKIRGRLYKKNEYWKDVNYSRQQNKIKYLKNRDSILEIGKRWYRRNTQYVKVYDSKRIGNLSDSYIANRLGVKLSNIPSEIIETKRLTILLKRELGIGAGRKRKIVN